MGVRLEQHAVRAVDPVDAVLSDPGFAEVAAAGTPVADEFRCTDCGYGVVVQRALPRCPMCGGSVWESREILAPRLAR